MVLKSGIFFFCGRGTNSKNMTSSYIPTLTLNIYFSSSSSVKTHHHKLMISFSQSLPVNFVALGPWRLYHSFVTSSTHCLLLFLLTYQPLIANNAEETELHLNDSFTYPGVELLPFMYCVPTVVFGTFQAETHNHVWNLFFFFLDLMKFGSHCCVDEDSL